ncbi:L-lactate dehydrogenase [Faecalicatena acetigenes]|uniref:L-lactate dehydrogenase n=1 Tax=Faecalicatena acetigenes TaxID=2981790 RepID=A0ABT2TDH4_9FIRM|nr:MULTISPECIES: L-lactate dehydrogenase [Lachnospiraceae]MCU6748333.1 L-lactate dehydrogenase [Faecalicatena acetigenes]SCI38386.1 L-lactate dehydrogenase [uncultured Clostridium sp.]
MINIQKAAIIGCGFVGASIAYALMQKGTFSEIVLLDANEKKAEGEAMDISHGLPFAHAMDIYAGKYEDIRDASVIIITAGANQRPGETRLDLVQKNAGIMKSIIREIKRVKCEGILLIVSNPVDILTYVALKESGFPSSRVIGSGTVLDTARLKYILSEKLKVDSRNVHAFIIGEHGDSELPVWSCANIYGIGLGDFAKMKGYKNFTSEMEEIYHAVRDSAYEIIERKGATYYGIGMAAARIAEAIVRDSHAVVPVSVLLNGEYGLSDLCLSIPAIVGSEGAEQVLEIAFNEDENKKLKKSAEELKAVLHTIQ